MAFARMPAPVTHLVDVIVEARAVRKILKPVIARVAVQMTSVQSIRRTDEREQDELVRQMNAAYSTERDVMVAVRADAAAQYATMPTKRPHAPLIADLISVFKARNVAPDLCHGT
jgi:hypothetical protein